jgi:hypothetical protein
MNCFAWLVLIFIGCMGLVEITCGYRRYCAQERREKRETARLDELEQP